MLPTADRSIDPGVHRFSYARMGATVTEIEGASHVVMISHPKKVAEGRQDRHPRLRGTAGLIGRAVLRTIAETPT